MTKTYNSIQLFKELKNINWDNSIGKITFNMANTSVTINTTDIVGNSLQSWLKQYFIDNKISFFENSNTQKFPDFFLGSKEFYNMLEIKSFNYSKTPAFDIANFESYCDSIKQSPCKIDADYLIFGYTMNSSGEIYIKDIWLKKIWEIAGTSNRFPLKTQVKRDMIYNIRPDGNFKQYNPSTYSNESEFIFAIYSTLKLYKDEYTADSWLNEFKASYYKFYNKEFEL